MQDFHSAGGIPVVMRRLLDAGLLDGSARKLQRGHGGRELRRRRVLQRRCHPPARPADRATGGIAVLRGNLAPRGAVLKPSAATPGLMRHRGRAVVFQSLDDYHARIDDPELDVDESCVMVLKGCGPKGYPGMPEVGNLGLPPKLLARGVTDMVRISDARMSGTAYGTVILHVVPEAAEGGTLALVHDGDMVRLDVEARSLTLEVSESELASRRNAWHPPERHSGGYQQLFVDNVLQADRGCDFGFLVGGAGPRCPGSTYNNCRMEGKTSYSCGLCEVAPPRGTSPQIRCSRHEGLRIEKSRKHVSCNLRHTVAVPGVG